MRLSRRLRAEGVRGAAGKELQKEIDAETRKAAASGHKSSASDEESPKSKKEESAATKAGGHKMTAAQSKQLAKLLDLYLGDHPDARGKSIEDIRSDVSGH